MAFETNRFCWHGCLTTDVAVATDFYSSVIGWKVATMPMGDSEATFFKADEKTFAHVAEPSMPGTPSHWSSFLRVDDVNKSTAAAISNGGQEIMAPMDIPPGRFSVIGTPSGASMALFHEADYEESYHYDSAPGLAHWVELHSTDVANDVAWLKSTFDFSTEEMDMPQGKYHVLKSDEQMRGGVMGQEVDGAPSSWMIWINVSEVDKAMELACKHGGNILAPVFEIPGIGRMGVIQDPAGGVLGVITPAAE